MTGFANWIDQLILLEQVSHQWNIMSYGFINDGRWSYAKVSVNYFELSLYVLTMFLLVLKYHIDGSESLVQF